MAKFAALIKFVENLNGDLNDEFPEVQETLSDLEDKQNERETEARGEKVEQLEAIIAAFDTWQMAVDELSEAVHAWNG